MTDRRRFTHGVGKRAKPKPRRKRRPRVSAVLLRFLDGPLAGRESVYPLARERYTIVSRGGPVSYRVRRRRGNVFDLESVRTAE